MFPIQATVTLNNPSHLAAFNAFITGAGVNEKVAASATPPKEAPAKKPASSPTQDTQAAAPSESASVDATATADAPVRTLDEAKALTMKIVAAKGRDAAVELLTKYGVPVAAKLAAEQVGQFCADADAVLAA